MKKKTSPYQFVIHRDDDGTIRATVSYRTVYFREDGSVLTSEVESEISLDKAGVDFAPIVGKFVDEANLEVLKQSEAKRIKLVDLEPKVEQLEAQIEDLKKVIADRNQLITITAQNVGALANQLGVEIKARSEG